MCDPSGNKILGCISGIYSCYSLGDYGKNDKCGPCNSTGFDASVPACDNYQQCAGSSNKLQACLVSGNTATYSCTTYSQYTNTSYCTDSATNCTVTHRLLSEVDKSSGSNNTTDELPPSKASSSASYFQADIVTSGSPSMVAEDAAPDTHNMLEHDSGYYCTSHDFPCGDGDNVPNGMVYICHYIFGHGYRQLCIPEESSDMIQFFESDYCGPCMDGEANLFQNYD